MTTLVTFSDHVLTINVGAAGESTAIGVDNNQLHISSSDSGGVVADSAAQELGFAAMAGQGEVNIGSIAAADDVRQIDIVGAAGTQSLVLQGGTFTAVNVSDGSIENVIFDTAVSSFSRLSPQAPDSDLTIRAAGTVLIAQDVSVGDRFGTDSSGNISISVPSLVINGAQVTLASGGGAINLSGVGHVSSAAVGRELILDARGSVTGGSVFLGPVGNSGGSANYLHALSIDTTGDSQSGTVSLSGEIRLDDDGQGHAASFTAVGGGTFQVGPGVTIDTEQGNDATGGSVSLDAGATGTLILQGHIDVSSTYQSPFDVTSGGQITLLGDRVGVTDTARLDASGANGAGSILIGGDYQGSNSQIRNARRTTVAEGAVIVADATVMGHGGKVVVWSDEITRFFGLVTARAVGTAGNGGFVEISGQKSLIAKGEYDLSAARGVMGTLLFDPVDIVIAGNNGTATDGDDDTDASSAHLQNGTTTTATTSNTAGTITFDDVGDHDPFVIYESEIEGTNANIILQATTSIIVMGTFDGDDLLIANNRNLTLTTRNSASDGAGGIDLSGAANLLVRTQGTGTITVDAGTDGGAIGNVVLSQLQSATGDISVTSGNGTINVNGAIDSTSGAISLTTTSGSITVNQLLGTAGTITIDAGGMTSDVTVQAGNNSIRSTNGAVNVSAGRNILAGFNGNNGDIRSNTSGVTLIAGQDIFIEADSIVSSNGTLSATAGRAFAVLDTAQFNNNGGGGAVNVTAGGTVTLDSNNSGVARRGIASNNGAVTITTDDLVIGALGSIQSGSATITVRTATDGQLISLGNTGAGLQISDAEFDAFNTTGLIVIGRQETGGGANSSGNISFTSSINLANNDNAPTALRLNTGGSVADGTAGEQTDLTVAGLAISANGAIGTTTAGGDVNIAVSNFAASSTVAGDVVVSNTGALAIGTVGGLAGVTTTGSDIVMTSNSISVDDEINARDDGHVTLTATTGNIEVNADVKSTSGATGNAGDGAGVLTLTSNAAAITTNGSGTLMATGGIAALSAVTGIGASGAGNSIRFDLSSISATNSTSGGVFLNSVGTGGVAVMTDAQTSGNVEVYGATEDVTFDTLTAADGSITVSITGGFSAILNTNVTTDGGTVDFSGSTQIVLATNVTIDTEQGNDGNAGAVSFGTNILTANATGFNLTIDTSTMSGASIGGDVTLGTVSDADAGSNAFQYLKDLTIRTFATVGGLVTLNGSISLDNSGADTGDLTIVAFNDANNSGTFEGADTIGSVSVPTTITLDTEQGNDGASGVVSIAFSALSCAILTSDANALSITAPTITETNTNQTVTFTVTSPLQSGEQIVLPGGDGIILVVGGFDVAVTSADGTAGMGDYTFVTMAVQFTGTAGETQPVSVMIVGDTIVEANETIDVTLETVSNTDSVVVAAITSSASATGIILNDDTNTLSISAPVITETNVDQTVTFTITSPTAVEGGFDVAISTTDGTAGSGDYALVTTTVHFNGTAGETQTVTVTIKGDTIVEANETFDVVLGAVSNTTATQIAAITSGASATGTILNDDTNTLSIGAPVITETNVDQAVTFTITSPSAVEDGFDVAISTTDGTAGSSDYALVTTTVHFNGTAGETQTVTVTIKGDTIVEGNETFNVVLGAVSNTTATQIAAITSGASATGTILNDDTNTLSISAPVITETNVDQTVTFTITSPIAVEDGFDVAISTTDGTAGSSDYALVTTTVHFNGTAGETQTVTVTIKGDTIVEANETFNVVLGAVTNTTATQIAAITSGASATGTILNDDTNTLTLAAPVITETNSSQVATFTVTSPNSVEGGFDLAISTTSGTAGSDDYTLTTTTVHFDGLPGETQSVSVAIVGDTIVESDETFTVTLGAITGTTPTQIAAIMTAESAEATIVNDDTNTLTISAPVITETNASQVATFTVTSPTAVQGGFDVAIVAANGTAGSSDYTLTTTTLHFDGLAGETHEVSVTIVGDTLVETNETFTVSLGAITETTPTQIAAITSGASVEATIINDDRPTINSAAAGSVPENTSNSTVVLDVKVDASLVAAGITVTYQLTGPDAARFNINSQTGEITFVTSPDYEEPADQNADNVYNIAVTATADSNPSQSDTQNVTITVTPVNDNTPDFLDASPTFNLDENSAAGTVVGTASASDGDLPAQSLSYSIVSGNESGAFAINPTTSVITVADSSLLDFETQTSFTLTVRVSDNTPTARTADAVVVVNVDNVIEEPVITIPVTAGTYHLTKHPAFVAPLATYSYPDVSNPNYAGATLKLSIVSGRSKHDKLSIVAKGKDAGQINVKGKKLYFGSTLIGTIAGGKGQTPDLVVTFNANASTTAIDNLVRKLNFQAKDGAGTNRTLEVQIANVEGVNSNVATRILAVLPRID